MTDKKTIKRTTPKKKITLVERHWKGMKHPIITDTDESQPEPPRIQLRIPTSDNATFPAMVAANPPSLWKTILQWLFLISLILVLTFGCHGKAIDLRLPAMPGYLVLISALSMAFTWVEVLKWGVIKPFNCVKCLTGWFALILALLFHVEFWYLYLFIGLFVGAMWSAISMRWL